MADQPNALSRLQQFLAAAAPEAPAAWVLEKLGQGAGNLRQAVTEPRAFHERALTNLATQIQQDPTEFAMNFTGGGLGGGLGGVIKPKGGNWLAGQVEKTVAPIKQTTPGHGTPWEAENLETNAPRLAINKWLDQKLTKYIKNEMATPEDPLRLQADRWAGEQQKQLAAKQAQLDKAQADFEKARLERGVEPEMLTRSRARILELEKERDFIAARTGLHAVPRVLPEHSLNAVREGRKIEGYPAEAVAVSEPGKRWEDLADKYMGSIDRAGDVIQPNYYLRPEDAARVYAENQWLYKVPPETKVNMLDRSVSERETGFKHMVDELKNALNPESGLPKELQLSVKDLEKKSVGDIADLVDRINAYRAVQKAEASKLAAQKSIETYKEYPDSPQGLRWVEMKEVKSKLPDDFDTWPKQEQENYLALPDAQSRKDLEEALKYEGDVMQHCVGGYCPDVVSGKSRIFSLRDANGKPHATVEVGPAEITADDLPENIYSEYNKHLIEGVVGANGKRRFLDADEWVDWFHPELRAQIEKTPRIEQIKGYNNKKPADEVIPYVQDFVKSQRWSDVGDLEHTGMINLRDTNRALDALGTRDVGELRRIREAVGTDYITPEELLQFKAPEAKSHGGAVGMALGGLMHKYADGGAVNPPDNPTLVTQAYRDVFKREPDPAGLAYWSQQLSTNSVLPEDLRPSLTAAAQGSDLEAIRPPSSTLDETAVNRLYNEYLGRGAEAGIADKWKAVSGTEQNLRDALAASDEYKSRLGVVDLYRNVLGRDPEEAGLRHWASAFGTALDPDEINQFVQAAQAEKPGAVYAAPAAPVAQTDRSGLSGNPSKTLNDLASAYSIGTYFIPGLQAAPLIDLALRGLSLGNTVKKLGRKLGFAEGGAVEFNADEIAHLAQEVAAGDTPADKKSVAPSAKTVRPEDLQLREGALSARPVKSPQGSYVARLGADLAPGAQVFADLDPLRRLLTQYGVQYVSPLPGGAAQAELAVDPAAQLKTLSGAYRQQLDKNSELSARGAVTQGPVGRPSYNVGLQYRKTFSAGGAVSYDPDEIQALAAQLREELHA